MVNSKEFSKRLQKVFDYYELNASSFAEKVGVGRASISHILSGRNKPSLDFVMKIINEFPEVELYWLLNGKGNFPKSEVIPSSPISTKSFPHQEKDSIENPNTKNSLSTTNPINTTHKSGATAQQKTIQRVIIFYNDGSFDSFTPNE